MSIAPEESQGSHVAPAERRVVLRALAVLASLSAVVALWVGERQKADRDLQLIVQATARPGSVVAMRALSFRGLESVRGPRLDPAVVRVRLLDAQGAERSDTALRPDALGSMGGQLAVPELPPGTYVLDGVVQAADATPARCRVAFHVHPDGGHLEPRGRMAGPLQHLELGPLRPAEDGAGPLPVLEARVPGGACIPEHPCEILVRVGAPAAVRLAPTGSVELLGAPEPAGETQGLVRMRVRVHGPEADTRLEATRDGELLATRALRLPVGLGEVSLSVERSVLSPGEVPRFRALLPPGRTGLVLDTYRDGDWTSTSGLTEVPLEEASDWPSRDLSEGIWHLQARVDPFSSEHAGARVVYVRAPGVGDEALLRALDRAGAAVSGAFVFAADRPLPDWAFADVQRSAAFLLAPAEAQRMPQPTAVSGRPAQLRRLSRTRNWLRFSVGALLLLSAFVVSATMVRRELDEQAETRKALLDAGDATIDTPLNRRRQAFWLWSMALGVAFAFVLAALLIVAKPLWF